MMRKLRLFVPLGRGFLPSEVFVGRGSLGVLSALGASRLSVILSERAAADPALDRLVGVATRRTVVQRVAVPAGEPTLPALRGAIAAVTAFRPDWIVAIGGGAVIDAAKLIWAFYEHPTVPIDVLLRPHALPALRGKARLAVAPTTAGSGAEASSAAVFQANAGARKSFVVSHDLVADVALLDPALLLSAPPNVLAASACDALAHAVEGYGSRTANPLTDGLAETVTRRILDTLSDAVAEPEAFELRSELMVAGCLAGVVQNFAVPGIGHAVAHQLAAAGIPHGISTGALLPSAVAANVSAAPRTAARYDALAAALRLGSAGDLIAAIERTVAQHGVADTFQRQVSGIAVDEAFVEGVCADPCAKANPVPVTSELIAAVLSPVTV